MKKLLFSLMALSCIACGRTENKPEGLLTANDFEESDGWLNGVVSASLTKDKAHSGAYSVKVAPGLDYSLGYNGTLGKISSSRLEKLKIHAWVYLPSDKATAKLVTEVKNAGQEKSAVWDGFDLVERGKVDGFDKWVEVEKIVPLPSEVNSESQLLVYLWRGDSSQPVYLDDIQLLRAE
jgi:hypothetical protein